jgi:uncharacterized membrane protein YfcA
VTTTWRLILLFLAGLLAGLIDSIAGGGGLITVPVLIGAGLPPQLALGTNKLQSSFGSGSAMLHFVRSGTVSLNECGKGILFTAIGAGVGTLAVQSLDPGFLRKIIPVLLVLIAIYTLASPRLGSEDIHPRMKPTLFYLLTGSTLGFYDGFFGPGTGSFWVVSLMFGLGYSMKKATGYTKVMNFTSNIVSLAFFMAGGSVLFREGLVMGAGQFVGARIGAGLVVSRGVKFIRPIFIAMVLAITARLLYQNFR